VVRQAGCTPLAEEVVCIPLVAEAVCIPLVAEAACIRLVAEVSKPTLTTKRPTLTHVLQGA
jgi:hypothetical protein